MLPKRHRLPIRSFSTNAKTLFRGKALVVKMRPNLSGAMRVGVIVSRGKTKSAVTRNDLRRFIFNGLTAIIRDYSDCGTDLLIIVATPMIKLDLQARERLSKDLVAVRASLLKKTK